MNAAVRFFCFALSLMAGAIAVPEAALAAGEGNKWGAWLDVGRVFNVLFVAGVVILVARKPLQNFFYSRTQAIREQLAEAQKARAEAEAKLAELEARMSRLDDELREIKDAAEKEAQDEYTRLVAAAEQEAEKITENSRKEIEGLTRAAQLELRSHAAELSVKLAEERIQSEITDADQGRLFTRFVAKLGDKP